MSSAPGKPFCFGLNMLNGMTSTEKDILRAPYLSLCVCTDCDNLVITVSQEVICHINPFGVKATIFREDKLLITMTS